MIDKSVRNIIVRQTLRYCNSLVKVYEYLEEYHDTCIYNYGFSSGFVVVVVLALDADSPNSPNGEVHYRIESGARSRFEINETTGVIRVAPEATFDYDVQNLYNMTVSLMPHVLVYSKSCIFGICMCMYITFNNIC